MSNDLSNDIIWTGVDPLGHTVHDLESVHKARIGKHEGADNLTSEEMHECIVTPSEIHRSSQNETRCNYYLYDPQPHKPPYRRVTVSFNDSALKPDGVAISWSRYGKMVSGTPIYKAREGYESAETQ